jgi:hypothetical protein
MASYDSTTGTASETFEALLNNQSDKPEGTSTSSISMMEGMKPLLNHKSDMESLPNTSAHSDPEPAKTENSYEISPSRPLVAEFSHFIGELSSGAILEDDGVSTDAVFIEALPSTDAATVVATLASFPSSIEHEFLTDALLLLGLKVQIFGLISRPELNGRIGLVTAYVDAEDRYAVQVEGTPAQLKIKLQNIKPLVDVALSIPPENQNAGRTSPAFTNTWRNISEFGVPDLPNDDVEVDARPRVKIYGLKSRANLNNLIGTIVGFSSEHDRFEVAVDGRETVLLKGENLRDMALPMSRAEVSDVTEDGAEDLSASASDPSMALLGELYRAGGATTRQQIELSMTKRMRSV